jgi:hypothetical protein
MSAFDDDINDMNNLLFDGLAPGLTAIRPRTRGNGVRG